MKRKTLEEIKRELSIIHPNLTILSNEYVARRHPMSFRCNVCGHEWVKHWDLVSRTNGCPKCSISQLAEKLSLCQQKESIGFKYPELIKYFKDKNLSYRLKPHSNKKIIAICPDCNTEKETTVNNLFVRGFSCNVCGDGISVPEKFFNNLLMLSNIKYESQKRFDWNKSRRYDFYLPENNTIIEIHGGQHYKQAYKQIKLESVIKNDLFKREKALENGISDYIEIDCSISLLENLKENITKSLKGKIKIKDDIWEQAWGVSQNSLVKQSWDLWEKSPSLKRPKEIADMLGVNVSTVRRYLNIGAAAGKCTYDSGEQLRQISLLANSKRRIKVAQLDVKSKTAIKTFDSIKEAAESIGRHQSNITAVCRGRRKSAYGYIWKYLEVVDEKNIMEQSRRI